MVHFPKNGCPMPLALTRLTSSGIVWALTAAALFTVVAALGKVAVTEYHVLQVLFFRQVVVFLSTLRSTAKGFPNTLKTKRPGLHAVRLLGAFLALSCGLWAVQLLPFATAITLGFSQVFFVALFAGLFLGETIGRRKILAVGVGFLGVLIVLQPGLSGIADPSAFVALLGAIGAGMAVVSVRRLSKTESSATLLLYQSLFVGLLSGIPLFWLWTTPDLQGLFLLFGMGILAAMAQWCGVIALKLTEASVVGVFEYTKLVFAEALGAVVFNERSDAPTLIGAGFIVVAALAMIVPKRAANSTAVAAGADSPPAQRAA